MKHVRSITRTPSHATTETTSFPWTLVVDFVVAVLSALKPILSAKLTIVT